MLDTCLLFKQITSDYILLDKFGLLRNNFRFRKRIPSCSYGFKISFKFYVFIKTDDLSVIRISL
jgi:hypothetical protein